MKHDGEGAYDVPEAPEIANTDLRHSLHMTIGKALVARLPFGSRQVGIEAATMDAVDAALATLTLYGYVCPDCKTWAEDMTPHCFNEHGDNDPVATLPFYVKAEV